MPGVAVALTASPPLPRPEIVEKFQQEFEHVLGFFAFPHPGDIDYAPVNLGGGWFKHVRRYLSRFPGCRNADHSEQVLGCFLLAAESKTALDTDRIFVYRLGSPRENTLHRMVSLVLNLPISKVLLCDSQGDVPLALFVSSSRTA